MRAKRLFGKAPPHRAVFSFPEVRWQFTKPNEVPLNMKETPTAPLFPVRATREKDLSHLQGAPSSPLCPSKQQWEDLPALIPRCYEAGGRLNTHPHLPWESIWGICSPFGWPESARASRAPGDQKIPKVKLQRLTDSRKNLP